MTLNGPSRAATSSSPVLRPSLDLESGAQAMLSEVNRAMPNLTPQDQLEIATEALQALERIPSGNLKRLSAVAHAAVAAAGTGALGAALARTAMKELEASPEATPARLGCRLLAPVRRSAARSERKEAAVQTAEALFRQVALHYTVDHAARTAVESTEVLLRQSRQRAGDRDRLEAVTGALVKLTRRPDDQALLESSRKGPGTPGLPAPLKPRQRD